MGRRIERLGTVLPPSVNPASGYWGSISFLDDHGFYLDADYDTALSRAGLRAVVDDHGSLSYVALSHPKGLFADGVSALGRDLLEILANEGFEGEVVDPRTEKVLVLAHGHLREVTFDADVEAEFWNHEQYQMVA